MQRQVDLNGNTGLVTGFKEQIKSIDEQLDRIQKTNKAGNSQDSAFERIRKIVGPRRSVGAARKSNTAQKALDRVDELVRAGDNNLDALSRLPEVVADLGVTEEEALAIKTEVEANYKTARDAGFPTYSSYIAAQEESRGLKQEGQTTEQIQKFMDRKAELASKQTTLTSDSTLDSDIDALVNFDNKPTDVTIGAVAQESHNSKVEGAKDSNIRNKKWAEPRVSKQTSQARKKIASLRKQNAVRNAAAIARLQELVDINDYVDGLIRKYADSVNIEGEGTGHFSRLLDRALELDGKTDKSLKLNLRLS